MSDQNLEDPNALGEDSEGAKKGKTPLRIKSLAPGVTPGRGTVKVRVPGQGSDTPSVPAAETPADAYRIPPEINVTTPFEARRPVSNEINADGDIGAAMGGAIEGNVTPAHAESDLERTLAGAPVPLREEDLDALPAEFAPLKERMVEANAH